MSRHRLSIVFLAFGACLVAALGQAISACCAGKLPQAQGEDVLTVAFGDARLGLSYVLQEKAEEYFHGGVKHLNCAIGSHAEDHDHEGAEHAHEDHHDVAAAEGFDPWQWIDRRVHVQAHRELKGGQAVDLLPWFWAAKRMSPNNTEVCENGAYVLAYMLDKPEEAIRMLEDGIRSNPSSPELDIFLAEIFSNKLHDAARAEPWFASAREKCLAVQGSAARAEELLLLRLRAVFYLGYLAGQRGDENRLRACVEEAESLDPAHQVTRDLRALLEKSGQPGQRK